jgi:hypothetical protein
MSESNIEIHTRVGNDHQNWTHTAQTLFAGRKVLERERSFQSGKASIESLTVWIEIMLTAFGIECLIKAIWLKQGPKLAQNGKYVEMIKNERHRLVKLCGAAGIALDSREADGLERMSILLARLDDIRFLGGQVRAKASTRGLRKMTTLLRISL